MAELSWAATSPVARFTVGRQGDGEPGVTITEIRDFELVQVMARRGRWGPIVAAAEGFFGAPPPTLAKIVAAGSTTLIWSGPDQLLALSPRAGGVSAVAALRDAFAGSASLSEQSDGRVLLKLSGPKTRDTLAKFCSLDLHPAAFPVGMAAATSIDHTSVNLWRGMDADAGTPAFFLLVFATFAESLLGTILDSAAEYGVELSPPAAYAAPVI